MDEAERPRTWSRALRTGDFAVIADSFAYAFFSFGLVGLLLVGCAAFSDQGRVVGLRVFSLGLIFAAASTVSGWLLGLLFGVPRTLARGQTITTSSSGQGADTPNGGKASRVNTNLEDISDWLTKTIVGVGLTQLYAAPHYIWHVAGELNAKGFAWTPYGQLLGLTEFFYFCPGGFWLGYVGTRTILTKLFEGIDNDSLSLLMYAVDLKLAPGRKIIADEKLKAIDKALLRESFDPNAQPVKQAAWGSAQARAGNLPEAKVAIKTALNRDPENQAFKKALATVNLASGTGAESLVKDLPDDDLSVLNALYKEPPEGFTKAIDIGERLIKKVGSAQNANLHVWLASAYGQKYGFDMKAKAGSDDLSTTRDAVVREVSAALKADPKTKALLRSLWKPASGAVDDDLKDLPKDDPALRELLD